MEQSYESHTPQFIKTVDYQNDHVRNSMDMGSNKKYTIE